MSQSNEFHFMLIDIDYQINEADIAPTIRLFGKTKNENVLILIKDFLPYFYITKKKGLSNFIEENSVVKKWTRLTKETTLKRYFGGEKVELLQLFGSHPEQTSDIRKEFVAAGYEVHEADYLILYY